MKFKFNLRYSKYTLMIQMSFYVTFLIIHLIVDVDVVNSVNHNECNSI